MTTGTGWRDVKIGTLGRVVTGKTPPSTRPELFGDAHPFITPTDIDGVSRTVATDRFISEDGEAAFKNQMIPAGAVCFVCIGATIGKMCIATRRSLTNQQVNSIVVDEASHDPKYVFYALRHIAPDVKGLAGGAATPIISKSSFSDISIRVAPLRQQRRIASILSAYDDLIENNTWRIAILEEMARRIYEEWFVRFRFPGHEGVRMVESELGLVPEGWPVVAASEAMQINPSTKVPKEGIKPFLAMNCLSDGSMLIDAPGEREGNSGSKFRNGDTLFARITPCLENGKTGFVQFLPSDEAVAFGSTEFIVLRSRTLTPEFVYLLARSEAFRDNAIKSMSGASGRQRVREACFDTFLLANPDQETLAKFETVVRPMFRLIQSLALKSSNLRATRDLLLPKLISGELDVSAVPESEALAA